MPNLTEQKTEIPPAHLVAAKEFLDRPGLSAKFGRISRESRIRHVLSTVGFTVRRIEREPIPGLLTVRASRPIAGQDCVRQIRCAIFKGARSEGLRLRPDFLMVRLARAHVEGDDLPARTSVGGCLDARQRLAGQVCQPHCATASSPLSTP